MSMRILVTGALGFVGGYVTRALSSSLSSTCEIHLTSRRESSDSTLGYISKLDITDPIMVQREIERVNPTHVIHLAGLSTISAAAADEEQAWQVHLHGTLNIAHGIMLKAPRCVLINVGSGQVYGASARWSATLTEATPLSPTNVQMATKAAADLALGAMAENGLRCIRFRPFNHFGPGQSERFVLPDFALQIARIKAKRRPAHMLVGNLDVDRDFLDVRDVASAYVQAVLRSDAITPGEIFNVASGAPRNIRDTLQLMLNLAQVEVTIEVDQARVRPSEIRRFVGDSSKAHNLLNWAPIHPFEQTLRDLLKDADQKVEQM